MDPRVREDDNSAVDGFGVTAAYAARRDDFRWC